MGFPSELPAMRRQTLPAPDPRATALAWASLSYAAACAVLAVPLALPQLPAAWVSALSAPGSAPIVSACVAGLVPAVVVALLARRATAEWPAARFTATYLAMLAVIAVLKVTGGVADVKADVVADCCATRPR